MAPIAFCFASAKVGLFFYCSKLLRDFFIVRDVFLVILYEKRVVRGLLVGEEGGERWGSLDGDGLGN